MSSQSTAFRSEERWYEQVESLSQLVQLMEDLPPGLQKVVSQYLNELIDRNLRQRREQREVQSGDLDKTLGMFQASQRRRSIDQNPLIRRALTMMVTLPEAQLLAFADHLLRVVNVLQAHPEWRNTVEPTSRLLQEVRSIIARS